MKILVLGAGAVGGYFGGRASFAASHRSHKTGSAGAVGSSDLLDLLSVLSNEIECRR